MVELRLVKKEFRAQLSNGTDWTTNQSDFATHLLGGVLENIQATFDVQVVWTTTIMTYYLDYNQPNGTVILNSTGTNWINQGFTVGDRIKVSVPMGNALMADCTMVLNITAITNNQLSTTFESFLLGAIPNGITQFQAETGYVTGLSRFTSLDYKFGLIENNEAANYISKLAQVEQTYQFSGIDAATIQGISGGNNKAWVTGETTAAFTTFVTDEDLIFPDLTTQQFEIVHNFKVNPFYRSGEINSLLGTANPPLDIYNGSKSLKYVFETSFRTVLTNPNTSKTASFDTSQGSVGYFNESYNGFPNNYSILNTNYIDVATGLGLNSLDVDKVNRVTFDIQGTGLMHPTIAMIVGHTAVMEVTNYQSSSDEYSDIWLDESLVTYEGNPNVNGTIITNYAVTYSTVDLMSVTMDIQFTQAQKNKLSDGQNYVLYCVFADDTKVVSLTNKVVLKIDVNQYLKDSDISGLLSVGEFHQYPHPEPFTAGLTTGFISGKLFIEDGQMCYADIRLLKKYTDTSGNEYGVRITSMKLKIVAYNTVTETWFDLRVLTIDLSSGVPIVIDSQDVYQYNFDSTRDYILTDTDIFNQLNITTDLQTAGLPVIYKLELGYKIPWQEWVALIGADTVFYDVSKPYNGLNNKASNYTFSNDYKLRMLLDMDIETNDVTTNYIVSSGNFEAYEWGTDDLEPDGFTCSIQTFDVDGNALAGNIINQSYTKLEATFTPINPVGEPTPDLYYAILRIEPINSQSDAGISELSTIIEAPLDSLLMQETGTQRLSELSVVGQNYVVTGLIDTSLITLGESYKYSAELRLKTLNV